MQEFLMTPLDTLLLRGSEPLEPFVPNVPTSTFPMLPRTLQGAVRTAVLLQSGIDLSSSRHENGSHIAALVGSPERPLVPIEGPYPYAECPAGPELFLPVPRYWRRAKEDLGVKDRDAKAGYQDWIADELVGSDRGRGFLPAVDSNGESLAHLKQGPVRGHATFFPWSQLRKLLWEQGTPLAAPVGAPSDRVQLRIPSQLFTYEDRTLIQLEETPGDRYGTAKDGMLNVARHIRLRPGVSFWFRTEFSLQAPCTVALGGERRQAQIDPMSTPQARALQMPDEVAENIAAAQRFWLVLAQPARLEQGWLPDMFKSESVGAPKIGTLGGLDLTLEAAAVGDPLRVGGFDLRAGRPSPLHHYVPAGSAWLFKIITPPPDCAKRLQALHFQCLLGDPGERQMGFGQVLVACCPARPPEIEESLPRRSKR